MSPNWGPGAPRRKTSDANRRKPFNWNRKNFYECADCGWRGDNPETGHPGSILEGIGSCPSCDSIALSDARRRVFCSSLSDWLDNEALIEWLVDLLDTIRQTPNLDWLLLTKRIGNWSRQVEEALAFTGKNSPKMLELYHWLDNWLRCDHPPSNVWIGATVVNQDEANRDIPKLLRVPARVRFLSVEPMLGPIDLEYPETLYPNGPSMCCNGHECGCQGKPIDPPLIWGINWIICGGESGPHARPMHPHWVFSLRDQCQEANVPFLFKQWGEWAPRSECYHVNEDGKSWGEVDPSCERFPNVARVTESGGNGNLLNDVDGGSDAYMQRVGKKLAGRLVEGRTWVQFPQQVGDA